MPVAAEGDKYLIDLTPFLIRDSQKIGDRIGSRGFQGPGAAMTGRAGGSTAGASAAYRFDESRSVIYMENTKNFPKNTEFEAMITFTGGPSSGGRGGFGGPGIAPDPNAITVRMHQSFVELPDSNYKPRKFDPRSGLNIFNYMDLSAPINEAVTKRFSRRHRLEKKDPGLP